MFGHLSVLGAYTIFGFNIIICKELTNAALISSLGLFCFRSVGACLLFWLISLFLPKDLKMRDILVTQYAFLSAYIDYFEDDGKSRGAYVISDMSPSDILKNASSVELDKNHRSFVHEIEFDNGDFVSSFVPVKPIPESEQWFEKVYNN